MLSLRSATMACTAGCIVVTAMVSLMVAVTSTNKALHTTNDGNTYAVEYCFEQQQSHTMSSFQEVINQRSQAVKARVQALLNVARSGHTDTVRMTSAIKSPMVPTNPSEILRLRKLLMSLFSTRDVTVLGFSQYNGIGTIVASADASQGTGVYDTLITNYGGLTELGTANYDNFGYFDDLPCVGAGSVSDVKSGICRVPFNITSVPVFDVSVLPGQTLWSDLVGFSSFAGLTLFTGIALSNNPQTVIGITYTAFSISKITTFLKSLELDNRERIFIVSSGEQNPSQRGFLVGVSTGEGTRKQEGVDAVSGLPDQWVSLPIHCSASTDRIIAETCKEIYAKAPFGSDPFKVLHNLLDYGGSQVVEINSTGVGQKEPFSVHIEKIEDDIGLGWWIINTVDLATVIGEVSIQRQQAGATILSTKEEAKTDLKQSQGMLYAIVTGSALLLMGMAFMGAKMITKPLQQLSNEMHNVAELRLDNVEISQKLSWLTEVFSMQRSFKTMVAAMTEYRQYLPDTLGADATCEEDDDDGSESVSESSETTTSSNRMRTSFRNQRVTPSMQILTQESSKQLSAKGKPKVAAVSTTGLSLTVKKIVTHVRVGNRDFGTYIRENGDPDFIVGYHSEWLHAIVMEAKSVRGVVERFIGDNVDISFGALQYCSMPTSKAGQFCVRIRDISTSKLSQFLLLNGLTYQTENFTVIGVSTGTTLAGNLGCQGFKAPSTIGKSIHIACGMQTVSREIGLDVILDGRTADDLCGGFVTVPVDVIYYQGKRNKITCFFLKGKQTKDTVGEWMYAMQNDSNIYGKAWDTLANGDLRKALTELQEIRNDEIASRVATRLRLYIDDVVKLTSREPTEYVRVQTVGNLPIDIIRQVESTCPCSNPLNVIPATRRSVTNSGSKQTLISFGQARNSVSSNSASLHPTSAPTRMLSPTGTPIIPSL